MDGLIIEEIKRYGLYILIKFENTGMLIYLGAYGRLFLDEGIAEIPNDCCFIIQLEDRWQLRYIDSRKFSKIWHMAYAYCKSYVEKNIGPEFYSISLESFMLVVRQDKYKNKFLKDLLLEPMIIAGIGIIYSSEICYEAYINPKKLIKDLTDKQIENIYFCIRRVLNRAIKNKGLIASDYKINSAKKFLRVYKNRICYRCNSGIVRKKISGNEFYYCPKCQKL